jgi:hypothetical protein
VLTLRLKFWSSSRRAEHPVEYLHPHAGPELSPLGSGLYRAPGKRCATRQTQRTLRPPRVSSYRERIESVLSQGSSRFPSRLLWAGCPPIARTGTRTSLCFSAYFSVGRPGSSGASLRSIHSASGFTEFSEGFVTTSNTYATPNMGHLEDAPNTGHLLAWWRQLMRREPVTPL